MDSSSTTSSLHLAMAALVGASLIAISAFYIHKRSVDQVLQRLIEIRRKPSRNAGNLFVIDYDDEAEEEAEAEEEEEERDDDGGYGSDEEMAVDREMWGRSLSRSLDENMLRSYIISASLPNVASRNDWLDEDPKLDQPPVGLRAHGFAFSLDRPNLIPQGLPPLRLHQRDGENQYVKRSGIGTRIASVGRLVTPRSPGGNAFDSAGDSDEEATELANGDDILFNYGYIDSSTDITNAQDVNSDNHQNLCTVPIMGDGGNFMQDKICRPTVSEAKDGVDLASVHIVGNDRNFGNTNIPLRTTVHGSDSMSTEEEEVRKMICECLDLRKSYVYREIVEPWMVETVGESSASEMHCDPFHFEPAEATAHHFKMEDGVVHVCASEDDSVDLSPVASST